MMTDLQKIKAYYRIFREISRLVHSATRVDEILETVVRKATDVLHAKGSILRILNLETDQLELSAAHGLGRAYLSKGPVSSHKTITDLCRQNDAIIIRDIMTDSRVQYPEEAWKEGIRSILDLPLSFGEHVIGILRIYFPDSRDLSKDELDFMVAIAQQCAFAIDKARLIESQQHQYDQLALHTEKLSALGRMAAGIAHEINNPLAGILLYSSNMAKKVPQDGPLKEGFDIIIHEIIRCRGIIQELLEFSQERKPEQYLTSINRILEKAFSILDNEFRLKHIHLEKKLTAGLPKLFLDENQMEQVFVNLLLNAIEAVGDHGQIRVTSKINGANYHVVVEIRDNGGGIPTENLNKIFEPFFSTKSKGSGLGLAVSYGIIQNHQGEIRVASGQGIGTTFRIEIPIDPKRSPEMVTGKSDEAEQDSGSRR